MKNFNVVGKIWPEMVIQWPFMSDKFSLFFLTKLQKTGSKEKVFYVLAFDLIKVLKSWASQKGRQILSFLKAINVCSWQKMTRNGLKMSNS